MRYLQLLTRLFFLIQLTCKIYEVIENLNNKGMIANPITLKNFFEKDNMLGSCGTEYLVKLTRFSVQQKQAVDYAKIIHEMYLRRASDDFRSIICRYFKCQRSRAKCRKYN